MGKEFYLLLMASTGTNLLALYAGIIPAIKPIKEAKIIPVIKLLRVITNLKDESVPAMKILARPDIPQVSMIPKIPPKMLRTTASVKK